MAGMLRSSVLAALALIPGLMAAPAAATGPVSWRTQIQPIFEAKCVACHACYESPCQLNLGSGEGLLRGASTQGVYDGTRKESVTPTRLFVDARSVAEWRRQGFHSVLPAAAGEASLLGEMLALGREAKFVPNARLPDDIALGETRQNSCPADAGGLAEFRKKHPLEGMPLGVTGLSDREYGLIETWLAQGAPVDALPRKATAGEQRQIAQWEGFLNQRGAREQLVARWLYEHLFIAHLYFDNLKQPGGPQFFELVRSRTAPGRDIDIIATAAPNDDPGVRSTTASGRCRARWCARPTSSSRSARTSWSAPAASSSAGPGRWRRCPATARRSAPTRSPLSLRCRRWRATSSCSIAPNTSCAPSSAGRSATARSPPT